MTGLEVEVSVVELTQEVSISGAPPETEAEGQVVLQMSPVKQNTVEAKVVEVAFCEFRKVVEAVVAKKVEVVA